MAGLGGLLSGLGAKIGGAARGAQDALVGLPTFTATENELPPGLLGGETLKLPPTLTPTGQKEGGLLSHFLNTGEDGVTGSDRLYALGSILQGDSGGAQSFLGAQRAQAQAAQEKTRRDELEKAGLDALSSSMDERGNFDMRAYLSKVKGLGVDPSAGLRMAETLAPKVSLQNAGGGGLYAATQRPFGGTPTVEQLVAPPQAKLATGMRYNPETGAPEVDPTYVDLQERVAAAKRKGAPPVGRSGGGGRQKSYGENEVTWGSS